VNVALPNSRMTVPQFFDWWKRQPDGERFELVDGAVVMMGRDRAGHNLAKLRATNALSAGIAAAGLDCTAFIDGIGVSPNEKNYRLPDAVVHCGPFSASDLILPNPIIAVEVVSPTSEERDVHGKMFDYFAMPSLRHYLIVFLERRFVVHHWRDDSSDTVHTKFTTSGFIELSPPGLRLAVADLLGPSASNSNLET